MRKRAVIRMIAKLGHVAVLKFAPCAKRLCGSGMEIHRSARKRGILEELVSRDAAITAFC